MEENQKNKQRSKDNNKYIIIPIIISIVSIIIVLFSIYVVINSKEMFSGFGILAGIMLLQFILGFIWIFYDSWINLKEKLSRKHKHSSFISFIICLLVIFAIILGIILFIKIYDYFVYLHLENQPTPANIFVGDK